MAFLHLDPPCWDRAVGFFGIDEILGNQEMRLLQTASWLALFAERCSTSRYGWHLRSDKVPVPGEENARRFVSLQHCAEPNGEALHAGLGPGLLIGKPDQETPPATNPCTKRGVGLLRILRR